MHMLRDLLLFASIGLCSSAFAQDPEAVRIGVHLKALVNATDVQQDSLSLLVENDLRSLLERQDALSASFNDVPMTRVDAPDGAFRLFTWNLPRKDGGHQYKGLLLVRTDRGTVLHELKDQTSRITTPELPDLGADRWYGALYYDVVPVKKGARTLYTLLGWKGYSRSETRKVIEVLSFKGGTPRFGAPLFGKGKIRAMRKVFGYSFQASMMLRREPGQAMIVMDHLSPQRQDMTGQWAFYGPDLSYDAYVWDKGQWRLDVDIDARDRQKDPRPFKAPPPEPKP